MSLTVSGQRLKLPPVGHRFDSRLCRVAFLHVDDEYHMSVDTNYMRVFTEDTLPDEIKTKLAMIKATPLPNSFFSAGKEFPRSYELSLYSNRHNDDLSEVGWVVDDDLYCLVIPYSLLSSLKGERLIGEAT